MRGVFQNYLLCRSASWHRTPSLVVLPNGGALVTFCALVGTTRVALVPWFLLWPPSLRLSGLFRSLHISPPSEPSFDSVFMGHPGLKLGWSPLSKVFTGYENDGPLQWPIILIATALYGLWTINGSLCVFLSRAHNMYTLVIMYCRYQVRPASNHLSSPSPHHPASNHLSITEYTRKAFWCMIMMGHVKKTFFFFLCRFSMLIFNFDFQCCIFNVVFPMLYFQCLF